METTLLICVLLLAKVTGAGDAHCPCSVRSGSAKHYMRGSHSHTAVDLQILSVCFNERFVQEAQLRPAWQRIPLFEGTWCSV